MTCTQTDPPGGSTGPRAESAIYDCPVVLCCAQHVYVWHTSDEHVELAYLQHTVSQRHLDDDISERSLNSGSTMQRNGCSRRHFAWIHRTHGVVPQDRLGGRRIPVRQTDDDIGSPIPCTTRRLEFCTGSGAVSPRTGTIPEVTYRSRAEHQ